jgi:hypothetical protein
MTEVLEFNTSNWYNIDDEFGFGILFEINKIKKGYYLQNKLKNEHYLVKLKNVYNSTFDFLLVSSKVSVMLHTTDTNKLGEFTYNDGKLEGNLDNEHYTINWNEDYNAAELRSGDQLIVLFKYLNDRIVFYLHNTLTEKQLGDLFNLIFIYDFSDLVQQKLKTIRTY